MGRCVSSFSVGGDVRFSGNVRVVGCAGSSGVIRSVDEGGD